MNWTMLEMKRRRPNGLMGMYLGGCVLALGLLIGLSAGPAWADAEGGDAREPDSSTTVTRERTTTVRETVVTETYIQTGESPVVAIFVKNRAGQAYDDQIMVFEDLLSSELAGADFRVMSREDVINSVASFGDEGANAGDENLDGADLDKLLSNNTSATRLAQSMGADFLLTASIVSVNHNKKRFADGNIDRTIFESRMRVSYKVLDRARAASVTGGTALSVFKSVMQDQVDESTWAQRKHTYAEEVGAMDELVSDAAGQLAEHLAERRQKVAVEPDEVKATEWTVVCGAANIVVPSIVETEDGGFVVGEHQLPLNPMNVTVELNGVVVGTAPGSFEVPRGLSKLRLTREGYKTIERTVNVVPGQTLRIDLQMTDEEYARWKDMTAFLETLRADAKLTDAQAERVRGFAQMLRQSGYKVDVTIDSELENLQQLWAW